MCKVGFWYSHLSSESGGFLLQHGILLLEVLSAEGKVLSLEGLKMKFKIGSNFAP